MLAKVVEGRKIGRTLGFPTANLEFQNPAEMPENGVYGVDVTITGQTFRGVLNVGIRPTFGVSERVAEVHILDFSQDIYNQILDISIQKFIRHEKPFDSPEGLKRQIEEDIAVAIKT
ncbi:MAG: riboflavin kinase [Bacteroidales bacterium]|jgi:riboflavin kinase/FMN adenylyltransferase|nr:riboflavin kinase [Bacteroidales bacterium]